MIPYPDVGNLPEPLARSVSRMVRLVNEMHRRHPELDCFAIQVEDDLDRQALFIVARHIDRLELSFRILPAPTVLPERGPGGMDGGR